MIKPLIPMHRPAREHTVGSHDVSLMAGIEQLFGDKAYRGDPFRKSFHKDHIPPVNRKERAGHDKKPTGVIERCCCVSRRRTLPHTTINPPQAFFQTIRLVAALVIGIWARCVWTPTNLRVSGFPIVSGKPRIRLVSTKPCLCRF
jgi:hypothetical protein